MSTHTHEELEARLTELFDSQSRAMNTDAHRTWDGEPWATVADLAEHRNRRRWIGGGIGIAAIAAAVAVVLAIGNTPSRVVTRPVTPATQPPVPAVHPVVSWTSEKGLVKFAADEFSIHANGQDFTAQGPTVSVHSDPGDPGYWTMELDWDEHGVHMMMNIYFKSDGRDWWSDEIRTYNGKAEGDWIEYHGTYFKTPLGRPFVGDLELRDAASGSALHIKGLRLDVSPQKFDCNVGSGTDAIVSSFERPVIELMAPGSETGESYSLLDRASCAQVANPSAYALSWSSADPKIAKVAIDCTQMPADECAGGDLPTFTGVKAGSTTFHVVAKNRATSAVVGERDFPVTVAAP